MLKTLAMVSVCFLAGCGGSTPPAKDSGSARAPLALLRDPVDLRTGEALDAEGHVPRRTQDQSTPSYALLSTETLWKEIVKSRNYVFVAVKSRQQTRGFYQDKLLLEV